MTIQQSQSKCVVQIQGNLSYYLRVMLAVWHSCSSVELTSVELDSWDHACQHQNFSRAKTHRTFPRAKFFLIIRPFFAQIFIWLTACEWMPC